jgi:acetyl/propionyl-CoA carboxylase alpha subunit
MTALLVANRGEIALRIFETAKAEGLRALAVYTEADAGAPHVAAADAAARIDSYLSIGSLLQAAQALGADAVHPGYGFLSERADFAQAVIDAGLLWVGPTPEAIAAMGSKAAARQRMAAAGVPTVPGYDGDDADDSAFLAAAARIGYPVLVKASAGGGGKGMRVVEAAPDLPAALAEARRLAKGAFGDDRLILERYLRRPRHIEVQVIGDAHGNLLHLGERECSVQRRHQKVLEEAPSPAFVGPAGEARREALHADALRAAATVRYTSAGTVEFIVDEGGQHYFLEMNTRIQVEHPVTEEVAFVDLVSLQLAVARGEALSLRPEDQFCEGHAVEVRLYAEDPDRGYLPTGGRVLCWQPPQGDLRVDAALADGMEVGSAYDPMLAKLIGHGPTRASALSSLRSGLSRMRLLGMVTNREWLLRLLALPAVAEGALHTGLLEEHAADLRPPARPPVGALAAALLRPLLDARAARPLPGLRPRFRNNPWPALPYRLEVNGTVGQLCLEDGLGGTFVLRPDRGEDGLAYPGEAPALLDAPVVVRVLGQEGLDLRLEVDGVASRYTVVAAGPAGAHWVQTDEATVYVVHLPDRPVASDAAQARGGGTAPMPGKIVRVCVSVGEAVEADAPLVVMEAMKMEHIVRAPRPGVVASICVEAGAQVAAGAALVVVD